MAKRQSFIMEAKPLHTQKPKAEKLNSQSKQRYLQNQIAESYVFFISFSFFLAKNTKYDKAQYSFPKKNPIIIKIMLRYIVN